jgi:hypothetical protein
MTRVTPPSRARRQSAANEPSQNPAVIDFAPLDEFLQHHIRWFDQVAALQTTWLTSYLALQADCLRLWTSGTPQLPPWMVWQPGAEQLA